MASFGFAGYAYPSRTALSSPSEQIQESRCLASSLMPPLIFKMLSNYAYYIYRIVDCLPKYMGAGGVIRGTGYEIGK